VFFENALYGNHYLFYTKAIIMKVNLEAARLLADDSGFFDATGHVALAPCTYIAVSILWV
jgi:hypothetical protein